MLTSNYQTTTFWKGLIYDSAMFFLGIKNLLLASVEQCFVSEPGLIETPQPKPSGIDADSKGLCPSKQKKDK